MGIHPKDAKQNIIEKFMPFHGDVLLADPYRHNYEMSKTEAD